MSKNYKKQSGETFLSVILIALLKSLWWLISLPFKKKKGSTKISQSDRNFFIQKRNEIEDLLQSENDIELKHALLEADKLVDNALKLKGYSGETFADRLRSAEKSMNHEVYNSLWQGHKTRNIIAHETNANISGSEIIAATKKLLKYLSYV